MFRPDIGRIEWEGDTDVRSLDLDSLIIIEKKSVEVYADVPEEEKPPVGKGLNKPAIILLHNIFPKKRNSTQDRIEFENKLKSVCSENGSEYLDYDHSSGDWVFRVLHFSRYGLCDSDEEEEGNAPMKTDALPSASAAVGERNNLKDFDRIGGAGGGGGGGLDQSKDSAFSSRMRKGHNVSFAATHPPSLSPTNLPYSSLVSPYHSASGGSMLLSSPFEYDYEREDMYTEDTNPSLSMSRFSTRIPSSSLGYFGTENVLSPMTVLTKSQERLSISNLKKNPISFPSSKMDDDSISEIDPGDRFPSSFHAPLSMDITPSTKVPSQKEMISDAPLNMNGFMKLAGPPASFVAAGQIPESFLPVSESPINQLILNVRRQLSQGSTAGPSAAGLGQSLHPVTSASASKRAVRPRAPVDMALFMNRSFRVGWTPDGRIVHCGHLVFAGQHQERTRHCVVIEKCDTFATTKQAVVAAAAQEIQSSDLLETVSNVLSEPLESVLASSSMSVARQESTKQSEDRLPHWRIPNADRDALDEYIRFARMLKSLHCSLGGDGRTDADNNVRQLFLLPQQSTWIILQALSLVDALHGQEDHMIDRLSHGRDAILSMLPPGELRRRVSPHL